jgi:hypothetical protein
MYVSKRTRETRKRQAEARQTRDTSLTYVPGFIFNVFLILVGFFFLGPGTYVSDVSLVWRASACLILVSLALQGVYSALLAHVKTPPTVPSW